MMHAVPVMVDQATHLSASESQRVFLFDRSQQWKAGVREPFCKSKLSIRRRERRSPCAKDASPTLEGNRVCRRGRGENWMSQPTIRKRNCSTLRRGAV